VCVSGKKCCENDRSGANLRLLPMSSRVIWMNYSYLK